MTTKELIELLRKIDPDGNMKIWLADGDYMDYEVQVVEKHECKDAHTDEPIYWLEIC